MSQFKFDNFAKGIVSGAVTNVQTTITLVTGNGARFPSFPRKLVAWQSDVFDDPQDAFNDGPALAEILEQSGATVGDVLAVSRAKEGTVGLDMTDTGLEYSIMGVITAEIVGGLISWTNVQAFGATGDGVTDDSADVISAFDAVADGGTVYLPVGRYNLATWPVAGQNYSKRFRVVGEEGSVLIGPAGATFLDIEDSVSVDGLLFEGWDHVLDLDSVVVPIERIRFTNCEVDGAVAPISWDAAAGSAVIGTLDLRNNRFVNTTGPVADLQGVITSSHISGNHLDGGTLGILVGSETVADEDDWRRITITGNTVLNIASALVKAGITVFGREVIVSENIVDGVTGAATDHFGIWVTARRAIVKGNIVRGVTGATRNYGIAGLGSDRANTVAAVAGWSQVISGNVIDMGGGEYGIFSGVEDTVITQNVVEECITSGIHTETEDVANERVVITQNIVKGGGASSAGINLQNATSRLHVKDNIVEDHAIGINYAPNAATIQAYAPVDIQICGNSLVDGAVGTHGIRMNPNTTNVTGTHSYVRIRDNTVDGFGTRWLSFDAGVYDVVELGGNQLRGNGSGDAPLFTVTPTNLLRRGDGGGGVFALEAGAWNTEHYVMGTFHQWVDATGVLRINNGAPVSDLDGVVVGTQT